MYGMLPFLVALLSYAPIGLQEQSKQYELAENIPYAVSDDAYAMERCRLDLYRPLNTADYATVVWFHGGALKGGEKSIPERLKAQGIAVVAANYRLYPNVGTTTSLEDAARAVAWVFENIGEKGGNTEKIFLSGHSAGGYLATMLGMDNSWLAAHEIDANRLAGLIPYSGHTITHMTVREEAGHPATRPIVDRFAPLFHVRKDAPPILLLTGDRELELLGRYEETAYFWRMLQVVEHPDATLNEFDGYGHNMLEPAHPVALRFIRRVLAANELQGDGR